MKCDKMTYVITYTPKHGKGKRMIVENKGFTTKKAAQNHLYVYKKQLKGTNPRIQKVC